MREVLAGQVAIVTGGSSGIGYAVARAMAAAGASVVVNYRAGRDRAEALVGEIVAAGGQAVAIGADVAVEGDVARMFAETIDHYGALDILVANSGLQNDAPIADMSLAEWQRVIDVNLTGQFLCAREAIRRFRLQGPRPVSKATGKIICMSSVHEVIPWSGHVNYAASKGGVAMMMKTLAQEVAPERIRVNAIAPGAIATNINHDEVTGAAGERVKQLIPYGRIGEADDVARAAVFLASDDSDYVVGTTLFVDGGMTLYPGFSGNG